jgi:hypothetical protein
MLFHHPAVSGKNAEPAPSQPPALLLFRPRAWLTRWSKNIFNGLFRVPVNEKIPALNLI